MKKSKIIAILLCLVMLFAVAAACNNGGTNNSDSSNNAGGSSSTGGSSSNGGSQTSGGSQTTGGTSSSGESSSARDTVVIAAASDQGTLDPPYNSGDYFAACQLMYEQLWDQYIDGTIEMRLAKEVEIVSPTQWIVHLQEGVKFSNGNPFTAHDVVFSIKTYKTSAFMGVTRVQEVDAEATNAIDDYTLDLRWEQYHNAQWGILSDFLIYDEESYDIESLSTNPIGTGPFKLVEYVVNSHLFLERRDDYWGEQPSMKYFQFRVLAEPAQRVNALQLGVVDISVVPADDVEYVKGFPNVNVYDRLAGSFAQLRFNISENSIFNNVEARYAACHAIDTQAIIDIVYNGRAERMYAPTTSVCTDFVPDRYNNLHETYSIGYDLTRAKEYADRSGLTGKDVTVITNGTAIYISIAEILMNMYSEIGVNVVINNYDPAGFSAALLEYGSWDLAVAGGASPGLDTAGYLINYVRFTAMYNAPGAWDGVDDYLIWAPERYFFEPDPAKRIDATVDIIKAYSKACIDYAICDTKTATGFSKDLDYSSVTYRKASSVRYAYIKTLA